MLCIEYVCYRCWMKAVKLSWVELNYIGLNHVVVVVYTSGYGSGGSVCSFNFGSGDGSVISCAIVIVSVVVFVFVYLCFGVIVCLFICVCDFVCFCVFVCVCVCGLLDCVK